MTIEEFREEYEKNLGRHSVNYTEWFIVQGKEDIYRILEWYSNRSGELKEDGDMTVKGIVYTTYLTAELKFHYGTVRDTIFSDPSPGHFVELRSPGRLLDGHTVLRQNKLLPQGQHLVLQLLDNDPYCALRRGSIAVMTLACLKGKEDAEPADCWPSEHKFSEDVCVKCGLVRRIPDELDPKNGLWYRISKEIAEKWQRALHDASRIGRKTAYRKKKRRQAKRRK